MSKKIGIVTWQTGSETYGVTLPYVYYFGTFGDVCFVSYDELREDLDMLVIPGGPDVDPVRYGERPNRRTGKPCPQREFFDVNLLPLYIALRLPIVGICRGMQTVAVHFGAKLLQHKVHETNKFDKRAELVHHINYRYINEGAYIARVNSIHHQVVSDYDFPDELKVISRYAKVTKENNKSFIEESTDIEAIIHRELPIALFQWHPEELYTNELTNDIITDLIENKFIQNKYEEINRKENAFSKSSIKKLFN